MSNAARLAGTAGGALLGGLVGGPLGAIFGGLGGFVVGGLGTAEATNPGGSGHWSDGASGAVPLAGTTTYTDRRGRVWSYGPEVGIMHTSTADGDLSLSIMGLTTREEIAAKADAS